MVGAGSARPPEDASDAVGDCAAWRPTPLHHRGRRKHVLARPSHSRSRPGVERLPQADHQENPDKRAAHGIWLATATERRRWISPGGATPPLRTPASPPLYQAAHIATSQPPRQLASGSASWRVLDFSTNRRGLEFGADGRMLPRAQRGVCALQARCRGNPAGAIPGPPARWGVPCGQDRPSRPHPRCPRDDRLNCLWDSGGSPHSPE
jgi:hypothetical protein